MCVYVCDDGDDMLTQATTLLTGGRTAIWIENENDKCGAR